MKWAENFGRVIRDPLSQEKIEWIFPKVFRLSTGFYVASPWFNFESNKWRILLIYDHDRHEDMGLFLERDSPSYGCEEFTVNLSLTDEYFTKSVTQSNGEYRYHTFTWQAGERSGGSCDFPPSTLEYDDEYAMTAFLKITCVLIKPCSVPDDTSEVSAAAVVEESVQKSETNEKTVVPGPKGVDRLLQNLRDMYLGAQNSDATLKVENREFPVHKAILRARSIVFASMFGHDMAEKNTSMADIPDCSAAAFEILLLYVYTGSCGDSICADNVFDLFYAADKYRVDDLKEVCVEFMKTNLSVDTFCDVIALALKHDESELLEAGARFFSDNIRKIIKTVSWQRFIEANPIQGNELYIKALNA